MTTPLAVPPSYGLTLRECLTLSDREVNAVLDEIPTPYLSAWATQRGTTGSYCEAFRLTLLATIAGRAHE